MKQWIGDYYVVKNPSGVINVYDKNDVLVKTFEQTTGRRRFFMASNHSKRKFNIRPFTSSTVGKIHLPASEEKNIKVIVYGEQGAAFREKHLLSGYPEENRYTIFGPSGRPQNPPRPKNYVEWS